MVFKIFDFWLELSPLPYFYEKNVSYCHGKSVFKKITRKRKHVFKHILLWGKTKISRAHIYQPCMQNNYAVKVYIYILWFFY